ncbi:MAG: molybdenum cofactor biosynthesis protein MoaE [Acidobacteriota bacterium]
MYRMVKGKINPEEITALVRGKESGACITFIGTVRDKSRGREVRYLEYDAYDSMAEREMESIGNEIRKRWKVSNVAIVHRRGKCEIGEVAIVIAISAEHREDAFKGCWFAIERIKREVPIWKKEYYADGEAWIGSKA